MYDIRLTLHTGLGYVDAAVENDVEDDIEVDGDDVVDDDDGED